METITINEKEQNIYENLFNNICLKEGVRKMEKQEQDEKEGWQDVGIKNVY